jgi:hypothetical protein
MKLKFLLFSFSFISIATTSIAQNGSIRGAVIEATTGDVATGVRIVLSGTSTGCVSDLDGKYELSVNPGKYELIFSSMLYDTIRMTDVEVKPNQTSVLPIVKMGEMVTEVGEVTISATRRVDSDVAVLLLKQKAPNAIDGISAASFKKIGDSDSAGAMTRVPGVSVANGKYIFIRGIGDRYNKTVLNGMDIPGLDPDRNTLQMDIFPTSIIDNMIVNKSFIADLPADFAGGVVDITLRSFPDERQGSVSLSMGYNPNYHFNKNYLTQKAGKTDFLGFDDGLRTIPAESNIPFYAKIIGNPNGDDATRYKEILKSFNPNMGAMQQMSMMDFGLGFSFGDQKKLEKSSIGYSFMLSYNNSTEFFKDAEYGRYGLKADPTVKEMEMREFQKGSFGVNSVMLSAMAGVGIKTLKSKYTFNILHLQNGESKSGIFDYEGNDQGSNFTAFQHNLEYSQRGMTNAQLMGKHEAGKDSRWAIEWKLSPTYSTIDDPDIRFTRYRTQTSGVSIGTESGFPERIWRELQEINLAGKADATWKFTAFGNKGELKFGGGHTYKERDFNIRTFMVNVRNIHLTGNPDELFSPENLWPYNGDVSKGTTIEPTFLPNNPNQFSSNVNNTTGFVSAQISPWKRLKTVIGLRTEYYTQRYTGRDQMGYNVLNNDIVLQNLGLFPSLNLVFEATEKQNIRFAYGKTIARPSFKEMSYAEIVDPLTGRTFIGGLFKDEDNGSGTVYWDGNLKSTDIHNFDLRWEIFPTPDQTISVSAFYKKFFNPIEIVQYASQAGTFQSRNVGDGQVIGGELEVRLGLGFISEKVKDFSFIANVTVTDSRIQFSATEKQSRIANAREGEEIKDYRKMAGQAPYVVNAGFSYNGGQAGFWKGLEVGVFYNVQGSTLIYVGMVDRPDVYTVPFHSLNFNANKKFGKDGKWNVGLKISNLLNDKKEEIYKSFEAENQYFSRLTIGTTTSLKVGYSF